MSKRQDFTVPILALSLLTAFGAVGWAMQCPMIGAANDHACCAAEPEPAAESCCSSEAKDSSEPACCDCYHAPDTPFDLPLAVTLTNPDITTVNAVPADVSASLFDSQSRHAKGSFRPPLRAPCPLFLIGCAFLI